MRFKQEGIILFFTLMILFLLTTLVLSQLNNLFLSQKALNSLIQKHDLFFQLENEAVKLLRLNSIPAPCIVKEQNSELILALLKNKKGCNLRQNGRQFNFIIEELGLFPCLQLRAGKKNYSSHHWRLNIFAENLPFFLQWRFAKRGDLATCDERKPAVIQEGLLSGRIL